MNDSLRRALFAAQMTEEDVAVNLEVDPKTVRRWLGGRVPYARHRQALAKLLAVDEPLLWPRLHNAGQLDPELVAVYPHGLEAPAWFTFFDAAIHEVDILHKPEPRTNQPNLVSTLERFPTNVRARVIVADPALGQYRWRRGHQLRWAGTDFAHGIYRVDSELLVLQHAYGISESTEPVLHLIDMAQPDGLFATYMVSFEAAWRIATTDPVARDTATGKTSAE
ncbi:helix-turn-helix domain-containing protein [Tenggerimyces flavus]|uniref:Multiprotein-bridging factor 1 family protein n=1 Tax=Tenggerimyces flavus TaxID=1708749 RepID=A0ABV7YNV8_9ACTN|nr:hypothetical protein [Tenggerimyces flavus]MBM7786502.1 transcriptional regulator with XRE-family HTH domain [Tenggerimyces flavus]